MPMTPEEFENQRRHNQPTQKHGATKGENEAKPGGNKTNDKRPSGNDQRDDRYDD